MSGTRGRWRSLMSLRGFKEEWRRWLKNVVTCLMLKDWHCGNYLACRCRVQRDLFYVCRMLLSESDVECSPQLEMLKGNRKKPIISWWMDKKIQEIFKNLDLPRELLICGMVCWLIDVVNSCSVKNLKIILMNSLVWIKV